MATKRLVTSFVPRTASAGGALSRLIGGLDCKGQGTNHPLLGVDPFVLCDAAPEMIGVGKPPFGPHPHYGLIAITYVLQGSFDDQDNLGPSNNLGERHINEAGTIYMASAGRGLSHSEKSASAGANGAMQTIVRIPPSKVTLPPAVTRQAADDMPVTELAGGGSFRLLAGTNAGHVSANLDAMPRFILARVQISPGSTVSIPIDDDLDHGFAYVLKGGGEGATIGGHSFVADEGAYLFGSGNALEISNPNDAEALDIFMGAGAEMADQPWVKLLGHNGFIIARDDTEAVGIMDKIDKAGLKFNYKVFE